MRIRRLIFGSAVAGVSLLLVVPAAAEAVELISIPITDVVRDEPGSVVLVARADVPEQLVGLRCTLIGETMNQRSVHLGNDLLIVFGDETFVFANFEDESGVRYEFTETGELPAVVEVFVRLGPNGVSSGGFLISIDCSDPEPPTSTSTSTTTPSTTTSSTTSVPASSSTTSSTTTVIAGPTVEPSLLSSLPSQPPGPGPDVPEPPVTGPELAVTGPATIGLAAAGVGLLVAGAFALLGSGRRRGLSA